MRIGLLIYSSLESISGGYLYDRQLVAFLRRSGDIVEVISLPWRNYWRHLMDNFSADLGEQLVHAGLDVLLQDELNHPSLFYLNRRLRGQLRFPLVTIVHHLRSSERHPGGLHWLYRMVERRYFNTVDGIICNSQTTCRSVSKLGVALSGIPQLVANPAGDHIAKYLSEEQIQLRSASFGPLRLLYVGNVIPRKNLLSVLVALSGLEDEPWTLKVVGSLESDHRYAELVRRKVAEFGLSDRVELCGSMNEIDLQGAYESSQVLVLPSQYEGYGIAYLEGMAYGLPAIASTSGAAGEIVSDGRNGFLVTPGSVDELRNRLHRLICDRGLLLKFSLAARERYLAQPNWSQAGESIRNFLSSLIQERR